MGRRVLKFDGAFGPEGCGGGFAADYKKRGAAGAAGCVEGLWKKVLRIDRPDGRRVLKFDGLSGRGLWYRPLGQ